MPIQDAAERKSRRPTRRALFRAAALSTTSWWAGCASKTPGGALVVGEAGPRPTGTGDWQVLIEAARGEGGLSLLTWGNAWGGPGFAGFAGAVARFEKTFPGVAVDRLGESSPGVWLASIQQARAAGRYAFDLALVQPNPAITEGRALGLWAPLKPLLFLPEVTDEGSWRDGLASRFLDAGGDLCFAWEYYALRACAINRELVDASEIKNVRDLLQPKWRGKIAFSDPRLGLGLRIAASIARHAGAEVLDPLLRGQRPTIVGEARELAAGVVNGTHPIAFGLRPKALAPFREQGLDRKVKFLDLADADPVGSTSLLRFDRAPHPAAAQLFANWILTRDGQTALTSDLPTNSARIDVRPFADDGIAAPGKRYHEPDRESNHPHNAEIERLVRSLLGGG
jgi:ABC-type Fe3+ transport system substrate-binding protein